MEEKKEKNDQQLNAVKNHSITNSSFKRICVKRNCVKRKGLAFETGKGSAGICKGIYANAKPGDTVATRDADQTECQDNQNAHRTELGASQHSEIQNDDRGNEGFEYQDEFTLSN